MVGTLSIEVRSRTGIILKRHRQPIHSWVMNALRVHANKMANAFVSPMTGTGGAGISSIASNFGNSTVDGRGIVIGTGTNASTFLDQALQTKIASGTGAGQMVVGSQSLVTTLTTGIVQSVVERTFANNSGAEITVNEVGIYGSTSLTASSTGSQHLVLRDVLGVGIAVPDAAEILVRFTFDFNATAASFLNGNFWHFYADNEGVNGVAYVPTRTNGVTSNSGTMTVASAIGAGYGLMVGTGNAAENKDQTVQFALGALIAHGTGAGQLTHGQTTVAATVETSTEGYCRISRSFVNESGGEITVREIAVYAEVLSLTYTMLGRKVLATPVAIPDGEGETFRVDIKATH